MNTSDIIKRIDALCAKKGWSYYKLAKEAQIPYSSLNTMMKHNHIPTIHTLNKICIGLGISLSHFFTAFDNHLNPQQQSFIDMWNQLNTDEQNLVIAYMSGLLHRPIIINDIGDNNGLQQNTEHN